MNPISLLLLLCAFVVVDRIEVTEACRSVTSRISRNGYRINDRTHIMPTYSNGAYGIRVTYRFRKRKDLSSETSDESASCSCNHAVRLSALSVSALKKMEGKLFDMTIERLYDPNGVPVYDIIKLTSTGTAGDFFTLV